MGYRQLRRGIPIFMTYRDGDTERIVTVMMYDGRFPLRVIYEFDVWVNGEWAKWGWKHAP